MVTPNIPSEEFLNRALHHYKAAAAWSSTDEETGDPIDSRPTDGWAPGALEKSREELARFIARAGSDLADMCPSQVGHDFWLTRNGHGAGFWDRDLGELGDRLTKLAEEFGERYCYIDSNNQVDLE